VSSEQQQSRAAILFTAFEPSADALAAPVIRALRERNEDLEIYACGGTRMQEAGAKLLEQSADGAAMGLNSFSRALTPAANFPVCRMMHDTGVRVVHLVAPQMWAWGRWRLGKLRRLTSLVLCILPFEEQWFNERRIPARFIGHPSINRPVDLDELRERMHGLPAGAPRLGLFPGSRVHEARDNTRLLADVYTELQSRHAGMCGVIVAASPRIAKVVRSRIGVFPTGLHMTTGAADAVIAWCDLALAVSGTVTLDIAAHRKPMIGVYRTGWLSWLLAAILLRTRWRLLPNIIAEREVVPEFVPHLGGALPIVKQASRYLLDSKHGAVQSEELHRVCLRFANHDPADEAAKAIIKVAFEGGEHAERG
jgi:lipid-A-disaccharide synthase